MKKKYIFIAAAVLALLILLLGCGFGGWYVYKNYLKKETGESEEETELEEVDGVKIYEEATDNYSEVNEARAEGTAEFVYEGSTYYIDVIAMSKEMTTNYLELTMDEEKLYVYSEVTEGELDPSADSAGSSQESSGQEGEEDKIWAYLSDGTETVRFEIEEGTEGEDIYSDVVNSTNPMEMLEEIDSSEDSGEDLDEESEVEVEYVGVEDCRELKCYKYIVTDKETDATITIWVDTDEKLPRIAKYDSVDIKGEVDIYYEEVDIEIPERYEDIDIETFWGLHELYKVAGDFVNLVL